MTSFQHHLQAYQRANSDVLFLPTRCITEKEHLFSLLGVALDLFSEAIICQLDVCQLSGSSSSRALLDSVGECVARPSSVSLLPSLSLSSFYCCGLIVIALQVASSTYSYSSLLLSLAAILSGRDRKDTQTDSQRDCETKREEKDIEISTYRIQLMSASRVSTNASAYNRLSSRAVFT